MRRWIISALFDSGPKTFTRLGMTEASVSAQIRAEYPGARIVGVNPMFQKGDQK